MEYKRYLKKFNNQSDYESQKDSVMGIPHVVLFEDTKKIAYKPIEKETPSVDYSKEYFTIEVLEDGIVTFRPLFDDGSQSYYSLNGNDWIEITEGVELSLSANDNVMFKGNGSKIATSCDGTFFTVSSPFNVKGNVMSLLYGDNFEGQTDLTGKDYVFTCLFVNCTTLVSANELVLLATTLASWCYGSMFEGCSNLTTAPELPATTLADYCYSDMFEGCTSLTTAPELPATTLASDCYSGMFVRCTSLTTAPELPATTLADGCYSGMFQGCTSLTTTPELPATTLAEYCYSSMFYGCKNLVTALELPATTLSDYCYYYMFFGCRKLSNITMLATDISAIDCLSNWVNRVASSGTFTKNPLMTSLPSGSSGIPNGWTVVDYSND